MSEALQIVPEVNSPHHVFRRRGSPVGRRRGAGALFGMLLTGFIWSFDSNAAHGAPVHILAFGDSITAGYHIAAENSLPAQLEQRLLAGGYDVTVTNAGVSGDTTAMGLARLDSALSAGPVDLAIIEFGVNDMGRGLNPKNVRANLDEIIATLQAKGVTVLLTAIVSNAENGQAYKQEFDSIYPDLAKKYGLTLVPFILDGVWGNGALLIGDGLHPNTAGVAEIIKKMAPYVEKTLSLMGAKKASPTQYHK
jgi:acyl-CoA thioesterase I